MQSDVAFRASAKPTVVPKTGCPDPVGPYLPVKVHLGGSVAVQEKFNLSILLDHPGVIPLAFLVGRGFRFLGGVVIEAALTLGLNVVIQVLLAQ